MAVDKNDKNSPAKAPPLSAAEQDKLVKEQAAFNQRVPRVGSILLFGAQALFIAGTVKTIGVSGAWGQVTGGASIIYRGLMGMHAGIAGHVPGAVPIWGAQLIGFAVVALLIGLSLHMQHSRSKLINDKFVKEERSNWESAKLVAFVLASTAISFMVVDLTGGPLFWRDAFWSGWGKILNTTFAKGPGGLANSFDSVANTMGASPMLVMGIVALVAGMALTMYYNSPTRELSKEGHEELKGQMGLK